MSEPRQKYFDTRHSRGCAFQDKYIDAACDCGTNGPDITPSDAPTHYDDAQASAWADGYESGWRAAGGQPPSDGTNEPSEEAVKAAEFAWHDAPLNGTDEDQMLAALRAAYKVDHGR